MVEYCVYASDEQCHYALSSWEAIRKAESRGWVIGQVLVITLVGVWSHAVVWLLCGCTPSIGWCVVARRWLVMERVVMRGWKTLNIGITANNVNLIRDSSRKIFWLWRWSSTLLFKLIGHRLVKNTTLVRGWSYDDVNWLKLTFRKIGQILVTMIVIAQIGQNLAGKGSDQRHDQPFPCGDTICVMYVTITNIL